MSDLDSFFAKKDKKKVKKGKKFLTTDEIAKRLDDSDKKSEKSILAAASEHAKKEEQIQAEASKNGHRDESPAPEVVKETKQVEEEWNDFKEDSAIDVSELKIANLNIDDSEDGKNDNKDENGTSSDNEKKEGVWKLDKQPDIKTAICDAVDNNDSFDTVRATVAAMSNSRWTSQNQDMAASPLPRGGGLGGPLSRRKKIAPDINNEASFPSLSDAQTAHTNKKNNKNASEYTPANGGGRSHSNNASSRLMSSNAAGAYRPPQLRTTNKFEALTDHSNRYS